jgi:hypothetical protein
MMEILVALKNMMGRDKRRNGTTYPGGSLVVCVCVAMVDCLYTRSMDCVYAYLCSYPKGRVLRTFVNCGIFVWTLFGLAIKVIPVGCLRSRIVRFYDIEDCNGRGDWWRGLLGIDSSSVLTSSRAVEFRAVIERSSPLSPDLGRHLLPRPRLRCYSDAFNVYYDTFAEWKRRER